jgi:putative ABC transport system substrate-binding protein
MILTAANGAVLAARQTTGVLPIVAAIMGDPVAAGFAATLARPGGNVTGLANLFDMLTPKQLQIFKETMPNARRIAILTRPELAPASTSLQSVVESAARSLSLDPRVFQIGEPADLDAAFSAAKAARADGVHVLPAPFFNQHWARIAELATRHGLPTISESRPYVQDGGLMSYGPNFASMFRRASSYVDRILKGAKPGDLPIEQPTRFEFVINMKTAKALGITIPQSVMLQADELIQ